MSRTSQSEPVNCLSLRYLTLGPLTPEKSLVELFLALQWNVDFVRLDHDCDFSSLFYQGDLPHVILWEKNNDKDFVFFEKLKAQAIQTRTPLIVVSNFEDHHTSDQIIFSIKKPLTLNDVRRVSNHAQSVIKSLPSKVTEPHIRPAKRFLIVDDCPYVSKYLSFKFSEHGVATVCVESGEIAREYMDNVETLPIDLVVTDQRMQGISGVELAGICVQKGIPVVLMSAEDPGKLRVLLSGLGNTKVLQKPIRAPELL